MTSFRPQCVSDISLIGLLRFMASIHLFNFVGRRRFSGSPLPLLRFTDMLLCCDCTLGSKIWQSDDGLKLNSLLWMYKKTNDFASVFQSFRIRLKVKTEDSRLGISFWTNFQHSVPSIWISSMIRSLGFWSLLEPLQLQPRISSIVVEPITKIILGWNQADKGCSSFFAMFDNLKNHQT